MFDYVTIVALLVVLSIVQSIFGMGILIFGTPTLLLAGYDFISTISILVPASFAISFLQVISVVSSDKRKVKISPYLYLLCLPGIALGLWAVEARSLASWFSYVIGATLILSALFRLSKSLNTWLSQFVQNHLMAYHAIMGIVHGMTNLGGALLAIMAAGLHKDKDSIRYTVAHYYLAFGAIQIVVIALLFRETHILVSNLPMAAVSGAVYLLLGNRLFLRTDNTSYHYGLTIFIIAYGIAVLVMS